MPRMIASITFALLLAANFLMIFSHGLLNTGALFTGGFMMLLLAVLAAYGFQRRWS